MVTSLIASMTIPEPILDVPRVRSLKLIGTSTTFSPANEARYAIST
jgi:hypothetical protein